MIKVCICDDDKVFTEQMKKTLTLYGEKEKKSIETDICYDGAEMLQLIEIKQFDLIFLDIELGNIKGYDIGSKLRNELNNEKAQIVYISAMTNYAMELFETRPLNFLVKPFGKQDIFDVMDTYCKLYVNKKAFLYYKWFKKDCVVEQTDIIYIQSIGRKLFVKTIDGEIEFYGKISDILVQLESNIFCQVHKSYVINALYVKRYNSDSILMCDGSKIMISQSMKKNVKKWLLEYMDN